MGEVVSLARRVRNGARPAFPRVPPRPRGGAAQPRIPLDLGAPVLKFAARIAAMISSCVSPNSARAVLSLSVAPLRVHSSPHDSMTGHYPNGTFGQKFVLVPVGTLLP
jgi:hypothetical protein